MPRCGGCGGSTSGGGGGGGGGADLPTGTLLPFAGATVPAGFLACLGQAVSRTTYAPLFSEIGTDYGPGDGVTTFNVPDSRDRALVGIGGSYTLGQKFGAATHTLTVDQMPSHGHPIRNPNDPSQILAYDYLSGGALFVTGLRPNAFDLSAYGGEWQAYPVGGGQAHNNVPPSLGVRVIIKT